MRDLTAGRRPVLLIGVGTFDSPALVGEALLDDDVYDDLPFALSRVDELAAAFASYTVGGFEVTVLRDPDRDEVDTAVRALLDDVSAVARVIHVISHGRHSPQRDRVEVVARCKRPGRNNVREWVSAAQGARTPTLFLVDLCGAGRAADLSFATEPDDDGLMAWVLAAARADEDAMDGAFSRLAAEALIRCAADGLGTAVDEQFVPVDEVARWVGDRLKGQNMTSTKVPFHLRPRLPFLPNPAWRADAPAARVARVEAGLRPFLTDAIADAEHFRSRAGVYFTGRQEVLDRLVPWLDGTGDGGLWWVTGAPGAGKSALLGAVVCAAHPDLVSIAGHVRKLLDDPPKVNALLVAVHARQRSLDEIVASIATQLGLAVPAEGWTAASLIEAIVALPAPPVVVVDALDECADAMAVQSLLLARLAVVRRQDQQAACRLLVGARPWEQFASVRALAGDRVTDLDLIEPRLLRRDLRRFLIAMLGDVPYVERLATGVADRLMADHQQRLEQNAADRWGQFLVAGRYGEYLRMHPASDAAEADRLAAAVPTELPQVLELELADSPRRDTVRVVLAALAHAKGEGMPAEVVDAVTPAIGPTDQGTLTGLDVRTYLRIGTDTNGTALYRLYHQGLADYLQAFPVNGTVGQDVSAQVCRALLATRALADGGTSWEYAPPYLLRHAIQHAIEAGLEGMVLGDLEFLVYADPAILVSQLPRVRDEQAKLGAAIYRSAYHLFRDDAGWRRRILELTALRYGSTHIARSPYGAMQ